MSCSFNYIYIQMAAPRSIPVGRASFSNPEWSVMREGELHFTQKGMDLVKSVLNKTGRAYMTPRGDYLDIVYFGKLKLILSLSDDEAGNVFIGIRAIRYPNDPDELTDEEKVFLVKFTKNLAQALPQDGKMNLLTKPTIPSNTMFQNLPIELEEIIRQQSAEYKDSENPMKKLTRGGRTRRLRRRRNIKKRRTLKTR